MECHEIYKEFEGKIEIDGRKRKYWIEVIREQDFDKILSLLTLYLNDEPINSYSSKLLVVPRKVNLSFIC